MLTVIASVRKERVDCISMYATNVYSYFVRNFAMLLCYVPVWIDGLLETTCNFVFKFSRGSCCVSFEF